MGNVPKERKEIPSRKRGKRGDGRITAFKALFFQFPTCIIVKFTHLIVPNFSSHCGVSFPYTVSSVFKKDAGG